MTDLKKLAKKTLIEKRQHLEKCLINDWERFKDSTIYRLAGSNFTGSLFPNYKKVRPKRNYYQIGKKYVAWSTYPIGNFDFIGEVVCIKSGWMEDRVYGYGNILGYNPWGEFKTIDVKEIDPIHSFISTIEIKDTIDAALKEIE